MKRFLSVLMVLAVCMFTVGCGSSSAGTSSNTSGGADGSENSAAGTEATSNSAGTAAASNSATVNAAASSSTAAGTAAASDISSAAAAENRSNSADSQSEKTLVVYFSCTGNTENIAQYIADGTGAYIYEIVPETPYTDADLNYNDNNSRSTKEMNDESSRPAISGTVDDWDSYTTVYIGYPIWWGEAPRILDTFVESYDFTGKTVIPFCTSASSGLGSSAKNLQTLAKTGTWTDGHRFSGSETSAQVMSWVNSL